MPNVATANSSANAITLGIPGNPGPAYADPMLRGAKGDGTTDDTSPLLNAIADAQAANGKHILFISPGTYRLASSVTIPANVQVLFGNGGILQPDSGVTVTIKGTILAPPNQQIFSGLGTISPPLGEIHVRWYGVKGDGVTDDTSGIQGILNSIYTNALVPPGDYELFFPAGVYVITTNISIVGDSSHCIHWRGECGAGISTTFVWGGATNVAGNNALVMFTFASITHWSFTHLTWTGNLSSGVVGPQTLIWIRENPSPPGSGTTEFVAFERCSFVGCVGANSSPVRIGDGTGGDIAEVSWDECTFFSSSPAGVNQTNGTITTLSSNGGKIQVQTSSAHGLVSGQAVIISGNSQANGDWYIDVGDSTHFTLRGSTFSSAVAGGNWWWGTCTDACIIFSGQAGNNLSFTFDHCGFVFGRQANILAQSSIDQLVCQNCVFESAFTNSNLNSGIVADVSSGGGNRVSLYNCRSENSARILVGSPGSNGVGHAYLQGCSWFGTLFAHPTNVNFGSDCILHWGSALTLIQNKLWPLNTGGYGFICAAGVDISADGHTTFGASNGPVVSIGNHYYNAPFVPIKDSSGGNLGVQWEDFAQTLPSAAVSLFDRGGTDGASVSFPPYFGAAPRIGQKMLGSQAYRGQAGLNVSGAPGSASYIGINNGEVSSHAAKYDITFSNVSSYNAAFGAANSQRVYVATLPHNTVITAVRVLLKTQFADSNADVIHASVGYQDASGVDHDASILTAFQISSGGIGTNGMRGLVTGDYAAGFTGTMGGLTDATFFTGAGRGQIGIKFDTNAGANLTTLTAGELIFWIEYRCLPL